MGINELVVVIFTAINIKNSFADVNSKSLFIFIHWYIFMKEQS
jgi:hypothetical protein